MSREAGGALLSRTPAHAWGTTVRYCPICLVSYSTDTTTCRHDGAILVESREWKPGLIVRSKYRIIEKIGRGGMGTVYKAEHLALQEMRALKVLDPFLGDDPRFIRRFHVEAKTARRVRHPGIVHVEDLDQAEDGSLFIAMEYVPGPSLKALIASQGGPLPTRRALALARQVADALNAAHALGIVHRDVKPDNILIATDEAGRDLVKIVDLGIAALREHSQTMSTSLLMTPAYAAPEQWRGMKAADLDGRADLYALGATLFEMLTGQKPFRAETPEQWMHAHLQQPAADPSTLNPKLAALPALNQLVLALLAKNRDDRPSTAAEVIASIDAIAATLAPEWRPPWPPSGGTELEETVVGTPGSPAEPPEELPQGPPAHEVAGIAKTDRREARPPWKAAGGLAAGVVVLALAGVLLAPRVKQWWSAPSGPVEQRDARSAQTPGGALESGKTRSASDSGRQVENPVVTTPRAADSGPPPPGAEQDPGLARRVGDLVAAGRESFERGDYAGAERRLREALALAPGDTTASEALGRVQSAARAEDEVLRRMSGAGAH